MDGKVEELKRIVKEKNIYPVYQPIVSMKDDSILGYEALTRIKPDADSTLGIEEMFTLAESSGMVWELEELCRKESLKRAVSKPPGTRLFINVNPNVLLDPGFESGITARFIKQYGLEPRDIVFEITERTPILEEDLFTRTLNHYLNQDYTVAIDDFGSAYAGLDRLCYIKPSYLKLDTAIIRGIETDTLKQALIKHVLQFCREVNIKTIAEGIETQKEMELLKSMGADYGQGYYFARPSEEFIHSL